MGQNYQAIHGSRYAGSLAPASNPASIVHVPFSWDITPISVQLKQSSNAYQVSNFSLLTSPTKAKAVALNGIKKRFLFANQDVHLLNARISLNKKAAIAFGANLRHYIHAVSGISNWQDTAYSLADYLKINFTHAPLSANVAGSMWAEMYGSYAHSIISNPYTILNAGITLKINRSLAGLYGNLQNANYTKSTTAKPFYTLTNGSLQYGYSANLDNVDSSNTASANTKTFLANGHYSVGADIGFEYIIRTQHDIHLDDDLQDEFAYDTKIGISLMDIGSNKYRYGNRSILAFAGLQGITDTLLETKFKPVSSLAAFNDSLVTVANSFTPLSGDFYIYKPTRLIINVDKHIQNNFFINAELTLSLLPVLAKNTIYIRDINLLAITPRWETRNFGAYFPILFNTKQQLWVGGAFKAGSLLFGTHNLANIFGKNAIQNGGFYLAFTIRPGKKRDGQTKDPNDKIPRRSNKKLGCPAL